MVSGFCCFRRNPFLFRGPIPTGRMAQLKNTIGSQSLLIQRSYSYGGGDKSPPLPLRVAIPSYSEVLFLQDHIIRIFVIYYMVAIPSYSEVLFLRGPRVPKTPRRGSRNPFLFRGPIPTKGGVKMKRIEVAIPSYSEVLFLQKVQFSN